MLRRRDDDAVDVIDRTPVTSPRRTETFALMVSINTRRYPESLIGGVTSIFVTCPSARIQNRTSCLRLSSGGAPWGILTTSNDVGPKISLALPPEPGPSSAPAPVPVPVPVPPPEPGPWPGPPVVPSPVPTTTGAVTTSAGGAIAIFTGAESGVGTVGTVTAGAGVGGTACARGVSAGV